jgi:hypothetical protein
MLGKGGGEKFIFSSPITSEDQIVVDGMIVDAFFDGLHILANGFNNRFKKASLPLRAVEAEKDFDVERTCEGLGPWHDAIE